MNEDPLTAYNVCPFSNISNELSIGFSNDGFRRKVNKLPERSHEDVET